MFRDVWSRSNDGERSSNHSYRPIGSEVVSFGICACADWISFCAVLGRSRMEFIFTILLRGFNPRRRESSASLTDCMTED